MRWSPAETLVDVGSSAIDTNCYVSNNLSGFTTTTTKASLESRMRAKGLNATVTCNQTLQQQPTTNLGAVVRHLMHALVDQVLQVRPGGGASLSDGRNWGIL